MKKILFTILFGLIVLAPISVFAAPTGIGSALGNLGKVNETTGLSSDISTSLGTVINTALSLVGTIFLGLMIYAGILWMTAQGNDDKVQKAKDIIIAAIIGLAVTMSAYAITYFVTNRLTGGGGGGNNTLGGGGGGGQQCDGTLISQAGCYEFCEGAVFETCGYQWEEVGDCVYEILVQVDGDEESFSDDSPEKVVSADAAACDLKNNE